MPSAPSAAVLRFTIPDQVAMALRRRIFAGELAPGSRLPSESALAAELGTNRATLREALGILRDEGLLLQRQGVPAEVTDFRTSGTVGLLRHFVRESDDPAAVVAVVRDFFLFRAEPFAEAAERGARNATPAERDEVRRRVAGLRALGDDAVALLHEDTEIHRVIVGASRSLVLVWTFNTLTGFVEAFPAGALRAWRFPPAYFEGMDEIARAFAARQPNAARRAMEAHVQRMDAVLFRDLDALAAAAQEGD